MSRVTPSNPRLKAKCLRFTLTVCRLPGEVPRLKGPETVEIVSEAPRLNAPHAIVAGGAFDRAV
jgi:hypothetical protein